MKTYQMLVDGSEKHIQWKGICDDALKIAEAIKVLYRCGVVDEPQRIDVIVSAMWFDMGEIPVFNIIDLKVVKGHTDEPILYVAEHSD